MQARALHGNLRNNSLRWQKTPVLYYQHSGFIKSTQIQMRVVVVFSYCNYVY